MLCMPEHESSGCIAFLRFIKRCSGHTGQHKRHEPFASGNRDSRQQQALGLGRKHHAFHPPENAEQAGALPILHARRMLGEFSDG